MAAKKKTTLKPTKAGQKTISFKRGGLHQSTGTPAGQPIPAAKMQAALSGKLGPKAQQQANMAQGLLAAGRSTAAKNRKSSASRKSK